MSEYITLDGVPLTEDKRFIVGLADSGVITSSWFKPSSLPREYSIHVVGPVERSRFFGATVLQFDASDDRRYRLVGPRRPATRVLRHRELFS